MSKSRFGLYLIALGILAVSSSGCRKSAENAPQPVPDVTVTNVLQQDIPRYDESVGTTEGFVDADIYPKISGYIVKQDYRDGDVVRAGQTLFEIDSREYEAALEQAQANLAKSQATLKQDQLNLKRYTDLYSQAVISRKEFDDQTQTTRATDAQVKANEAAVRQANLNLEWTHVTSPVDGVASIAITQVGSLVSPSTKLTTVSQLDPIKVEFPISEQLYLSFAGRINQDPNKRAKNGPGFQMILSDGSTYKYIGQIYGVNRQVDIQTGTIKVVAVFPNPGNILRPGLYAKIRANTGTLHNALLVPQEALLQTQGQSQLAVVGEDNKVTMRNVEIGQSFGGFQVIQKGVLAGEHVVTEGLQKVHDGIQVNAHLVASAPPQDSSPSSGSQPSIANTSSSRS
jgi:membrane fusion protein (multidrug efflux system)